MATSEGGGGLSLVVTGPKNRLLLNQLKLDCIYHFPNDFEPNGIPFDTKSVETMVNTIKFRSIKQESQVDLPACGERIKD